MGVESNLSVIPGRLIAMTSLSLSGASHWYYKKWLTTRSPPWGQSCSDANTWMTHHQLVPRQIVQGNPPGGLAQKETQ